MIRKNLKAAIARSGLVVKEVAAKSGVNKRTIDKWLSAEETEPKVRDFYKVCASLGVTMEEIAAGEKGTEYLRLLTVKDSKTRKLPERLTPIVKILENLDEKTLLTIRKMLEGLGVPS